MIEFGGSTTSGEALKQPLERTPLPERFRAISSRIQQAAPQSWSKFQVDGFEDILTEPLGSERFESTIGTVLQLAFSLSLSENPAVDEVLNDRSLSSREIVTKLREAKVLSGMRILDLGAGSKASFAIAAHALGAHAYTADATDVSEEAKGRIDGHVIVDLGQKTALETLQLATGGNFDLVLEFMIGRIRQAEVSVFLPKGRDILRLAEGLLKVGGYLYSNILDGSDRHGQGGQRWPCFKKTK